MANDKIFLVCRGCGGVLGIYKDFGHADPTAYISGDDLATFIAEHLYHHKGAGGPGDGFHLSEPAPFEVLTEHVLMRMGRERGAGGTE